jgi:O-antigen/teichoic acid export membrane protein
MYVLQIILLLTVKNYYAYLAVMPVFTVFSNIRTALVTRKMFPQYRPVGKLSKEIRANIKEKVGGLVIQKLCSVSRNAFDSIFVSMFLGLTQIAIYNNYYYIMSSVTAFMTIATNAVAAGAGNSVASETKEKNHQDMMRMNFIYMWIGGWCTICLLCLYQNFMELWVGKNLMLPMSSVILFCLYFYVLKMGDVRYIYDQACGIWWQNRYRAIAEALANICLNYFFGKYFGINGIIAATLISLFIINFCYGSQIIYKYYFTEQKINMYFFTQGRYFVVSFGIGLVLSGICSLLPVTLIGFAIKLVICAIVPNILYFLLYRRSEIYHEAIPWILNRVGVGKDSIVWKLLN